MFSACIRRSRVSIELTDLREGAGSAGSSWQSSRILTLGLMCFFLSAACSSLTDVSAPDVIEPGELDNPAGAETLRLGAISRFMTGFAGTGVDLAQNTAGGLLADELSSATVGSIVSVDQRIPPDPEPGIYYPYLTLQQAHVNSLQAIGVLQRISPNRRSTIGELFALVGYTEDFFAEDLCSGIPISPVVDGEPTFGDPLSTTELLNRSVANFDSARTYAADSARIVNLAAIGKGRALLNMGEFANAAAAVSAVPTAYLYKTNHSAAVQPNSFYTIVNSLKFFTVADREGQNGLPFVSAADPRVPTQALGKGNDQTTNVFGFTRYNSPATSVTLASGVEARLIEAEAALQSGASAQFLDILNALRADPNLRAQYAIPTGMLGPLSQPATDPERIDLLFTERAFWLFGTGHRHGDLRRLVRQYSRPVETVFPTGPYKQGQVYGPEVTFTPEAGERNNPNYQRCENREP
jgi:starch-binding outer membrane protein, SusD/RagB family